jgi:hypothetical protein
LGRDFFHAHFQYIMGGDRRASYDYILLVAGPVAIPEWSKRARDVMIAFENGRPDKGR